MKICEERLLHYVNLLVKLERCTGIVDCSGNIDWTALWKKWDEHYKSKVYNDAKAIRSKMASYGETVLFIMENCNLVNYYQISAFRSMLADKTNSADLESALADLFEKDEDEFAFKKLSAILGAKFDLLSFLLFLKSKEHYLPIRSRLFDSRFRMLGFEAHLEGHCTWERYQAYIGWMKEIQAFLQEQLNPATTLLDAHSFVWILPQLEAAVLDQLPEEIPHSTSSNPIDTSQTVTEGGEKVITVNAYERNPKAVKICKEYYLNRYGKLVCQVCGFDFGKFYGPEYANKIHIHHITPISSQGKKYQLNPKNDLIPVCPNCHLILHANAGISVEDLKERLMANKHN